MLPSPSSPDPAPAPAPSGPSAALSLQRRQPRSPHARGWWIGTLGALALLATTTILLFIGASLPASLTGLLGRWWVWWPVIPAVAVLTVPAIAGLRIRRWTWPLCCLAVPGVPVAIYFAFDLIVGALTGVVSPLGGGGYDVPLVMTFVSGVAVAFSIAASIGTAAGLALENRPRR